MKPCPAPYPAWGVDCVTVLDPDSAAAFRALGASFATRYLGNVTVGELEAIHGAGMLARLVTYADHWDGPAAVSELRALGIPQGVTVWLDLEGVDASIGAAAVFELVNGWADALTAAGYQPGLYVGANAILTSTELYSLRVVRYWRSMSNVPTPACGFVALQAPTTQLAGVMVDVDYTTPDYEGRRETMIGPSQAARVWPSEAPTNPDTRPPIAP